MRTIQHGNEYWRLHDDGAIERPGLMSPDAATWRVTGAVRLTNFGHVVERFSLADILRGGIEWQHKNGRQRVYIMDMDHGTARTWVSPNHSVA